MIKLQQDAQPELGLEAETTWRQMGIRASLLERLPSENGGGDCEYLGGLEYQWALVTEMELVITEIVVPLEYGGFPVDSPLPRPCYWGSCSSAATKL